MQIAPYLEDLESQIDVDVEETLLADWRTFCRGNWKEEFFAPQRRKSSPAALTWPAISHNKAMGQHDNMILQQLGDCSLQLARGSGRLLCARSNYGVPILAAPFGCELFIMPDEMNCLPNCHPLGTAKARSAFQAELPSLEHPYLQQVWESGRRHMAIREQYPKLGKYLFVYHPDFQGPMDALELIWGSEFFTAFVDEPEFIHHALRRLTDFYKAVMRKWRTIVPPFDSEVSCHWGFMHPGQIMLRDDSAMNLPPAYFEEFIVPYDQELLLEFGGGSIHACGRVDHYAPLLPRVNGLKAFNMSQPNLNDMETVVRATADAGLLLNDLNPSAVMELQKQRRRMHGRIQTFV